MKANKRASNIYTCPMHPEVISNKAGMCPKCGMGLVSTGQRTKSERQRDLKLALSYPLIIIAIIIAFAAGALLFGGNSARSFLPFTIFLLCPIMMIFMMKGKH